MRNNLLLLMALLAAFIFPAHAEPPLASHWATLAVADLDHIYTQVKTNHPGALDAQNPYFADWLERGYRLSRAKAERADSLSSLYNALNYFVAGFADGHFSLHARYQPVQQRWAGLGIALHDADYQVSHRETDWPAELPPLGARLLACDDRPVASLMREDVLAFRFNDPRLNAPKVRYAHKLLVDDGTGERRLPDSCRFALSSGEKTYTLQWRGIAAQALEDKLGSQKSSMEYYLREFAPDRHWFAVPSFHPEGKQADILQNMIATLASLREAELIVFDLRGNDGGNSQWGNDIATALYGEAYLAALAQENPDDSYALWRVSADNLAHISSILPYLKDKFGKDSSAYRTFSHTRQAMQSALAAGEDFVRQGGKDTEPPRATVNLSKSSPVSAKVVLLTDSRCGSACLDFADIMLSIPGVAHMGQETNADTLYMDIRGLELPSGLGSFSLAQKVYRNRARGHNQSYRPATSFDGDMADTTALRHWLLTQLDESLTAH